MNPVPSVPNARFLDATQQTVAWFWKRLQSDELEMEPPFQRNPVWQEAQKAYLIDSILRGYPVPELYLQTTVSADASETHVVVDGQQRIRACLEFINDLYPLGTESGELAGQRFSDLDPLVKERFFRYKFVVRSLPALSEGEVREIFGRLNRNNVALNRQELRQATYWGDFISCVTELSKKSFWVRSGLFTANDFRRMLDIEYVSELTVAALYGVQNKKDKLDSFYADFESEFPDRVSAERTFERVLAQLDQVLDWPNPLRWSRKVDFYALFLALAKRQEDLPFDREEASRVGERLGEFSKLVGEVLSLSVDAGKIVGWPSREGHLAGLYARGVRNSSDAGSRRLRLNSLEEFLWPSGRDMTEGNTLAGGRSDSHMKRLPDLETLLATEDAEDPEDA
ncbi:DUF262 domain-containing protein [Actinoplanes teichomyceticus]|uniref:Uncharacterized protein DUF262 n=1 Tax=Actinoplanes teichomyceticus TaxID=1867 RepID=A0A561WC31_ACTTI|nr:DUF262 domain-containing protein [Actinoplanes teichomyceticus]TWG21424.1 uncharacterized protein DUF262 [Actinoplanes teichomyceticus]GIF16601.1 hypothetical protein Ate01nite_66330 [Actinoplanes teichomyceticus]